ncbi:terpene synthase family protein [Streptomyces sp. ET3-23]|uniref:terpene synthase family protein n=1 Tax=Streptomyces sp. ET3-23 TaxID=2885643 RepID=UPI001D102DDF|nr:terpene synthase family protein [Streptomyces sp. ET3-23]MCC2280708.1 terpene synthase family protein [Streptomyces sp. ET3-23]
MRTAADDELWCPIVPRRADGEAIASAQCAAISWARETGLVRGRDEATWAAAWNVAEFAGRVYAQAADLDLAAQWILWMDVIDDAVEAAPAGRLPALLNPLTRIFQGSITSCADGGTQALTDSLDDLWQRTREGMSPAWQNRIVQIWQQCAASMPWEAANRAAGHPPSLDDYIARRGTAGAAFFALALTEGLCKYELPDALHYGGLLSALRILACDQICWANDLLSLHREMERGDVHNLALVLERDRGLPRDEAIRTTVGMTNERMHAVTALVEALPAYQRAAGLTAYESALVARAVDTIEQWIAGSLEFHRLSTRHTDHQSRRTNPFRTLVQAAQRPLP